MTLVINDEALTCCEGDNLLDVARQHGAHVWFVCDGRGVCRTCACRVLAGAESLSPPTPVERQSLSGSDLTEGYRLACQAHIVGSGIVRVLSVAEQLRRHAVEVVRPSEHGRVDSILRLFREMTALGFDAATRLPFQPVRALPQIVALPPTPSRMFRYIGDAQRMLLHVLTT